MKPTWVPTEEVYTIKNADRPIHMSFPKDYIEPMESFDKLADAIRSDRQSQIYVIIINFCVGIAIGCGIAVGMAIARAGGF